MANLGDPSAPGDPPDPIDGPALPPKRSTSIAPSNVAPDPSPGEVVGRFQLLERLGRGGAGSVFKAQSLDDGSICALKVLSASKVKRARVVQRFFDEVRAASAVRHHGLIEVRDFIEEDSPRRLAYSMEYLEGESLRDRLKREVTISLKEAIGIATQICDALHALHEAGIIHRDLKPENIMLVQGKDATPVVKLLDFGVVKFLPIDPTAGSREVEKPGTFVGTPRYMAPEQAAGATVDRRADLFSIGVTLFEMLTGRCPHEGDSLRDVVLAKLKGAPRITVNREKEVLPQELTDLVDACLQLKPTLRPADAHAVRDGLREAEFILFAVGPIRLGDDGTHTREAPAPTPPPKVEAPQQQQPKPPPIVASPRSPSRVIPRIAVAVGMVMLALILALIVRAMRQPDDSVLLLPEQPPPPAVLATKRDVRVVTIPSGATVEVRGTRYGPTPVTIALGPGPIDLVKDGFRRMSIDVPSDGPPTITATLTSTSSEP